jgi:alpha-mannosidase
MAEVTASVRRAVEELRAAEGMASLVALYNPGFAQQFDSRRDSAWLNMGLYFEHGWNNDGNASYLRPAFNRAKAAQIVSYVTSLKHAAGGALAALVRNSSPNARFIVFNPLSWTRSDFADLPYQPVGDVRVIDVSTGAEVRCQPFQRGSSTVLRILAEAVPSLGYRVYEVQLQRSRYADSMAVVIEGSGVFRTGRYRVAVNGRGAVSSLLDLQSGGRELVRVIGGRTINDPGFGSGSPTFENVGPVSGTCVTTASGNPPHISRVTMFAGIDRIAMENEITGTIGDGPVSYAFGFEVSGHVVRHEEVGAVVTARTLSQGGSYADRTARYDLLTMGHFVDVAGGSQGVTLSNWDSPFFGVGNSTAAFLDIGTPQINALVGSRIDAVGFPNQNGDTYFHNRYALRGHSGYNAVRSMRFALEHQNPLVALPLPPSSGPYPSGAYSLLSIADSSTILWAIKPAEEGIADPTHGGLVMRLWNLSPLQNDAH